MVSPRNTTPRKSLSSRRVSLVAEPTTFNHKDVADATAIEEVENAEYERILASRKGRRATTTSSADHTPLTSPRIESPRAPGITCPRAPGATSPRAPLECIG